MTVQACIVVPVFNHGSGAIALAKELARFKLPTFMVNDGSNSSSKTALRNIAKDYGWVQILEHSENRGKGAAVLTGLLTAHKNGFSHALQIDADGQHNPGDIPKFLALAEANPNALIAGIPEYDASVPKGRLIARYLTHVWIWIETLSFNIKDSMCGFRVYPLNPVLKISEQTKLGRRMDFDPEILVRLYWDGVPILSLPTKVIYPPGGQSHFQLWRDNCLISWMHTRLFFGMLSRVLRLRFRRQTSSVR